MQKERLCWLFVMASVLLTLITACGQQSSVNKASNSSTVPGGERLYVVADSVNSSNAQQIIALHLSNATATTQLTLPAGLFSQNHKSIYTATPRNGQTTISVIDTQTGGTSSSFVIPGSYATTVEQVSTTATLSADGKWLALRQLGQFADTVHIALINTQAGKLFKTITLDKSFYLDAISPAGDELYLLQHLADQAGHYYVRAYDVRENKLETAIISDKEEINDPRMIGSAVTRQTAENGTTVYTLYIDSSHNIAFVHILPLIQGTSPPYTARCIDLPVGRSANLLGYYTLTLSADGTTLYAANGALGLITQISLTDNVVYDKIAKTVKFEPGDVSVTNSKTQALYNGAVLSPDQNTLYLVGAHGIWAFNTADINNGNAHIQRSYLTQQAFTGIAMSSDGQTLYAVHPNIGVTFINVMSGKSQQIAQSAVHLPWGIAWVTG